MDYRFSCPRCSYSRWKTVVKGLKYKCLNKGCGFIGQGILKEHYSKQEDRTRKKVERMKKDYEGLLDRNWYREQAKARICRKYKISRPTFHRWMNK